MMALGTGAISSGAFGISSGSRVSPAGAKAALSDGMGALSLQCVLREPLSFSNWHSSQFVAQSSGDNYNRAVCRHYAIAKVPFREFH
jgi:hypothetical protein